MMGFQTDHPFPADNRIMSHPGRQVETVSSGQSRLIPDFWQSKDDAPLHHENDFVIPMGVCTVHIARRIRPNVRPKTFAFHDIPERSLIG